jgi:hypothetical protein
MHLGNAADATPIRMQPLAHEIVEYEWTNGLRGQHSCR